MKIYELELGVGEYIKKEVLPNIPNSLQKFIVSTASVLLIGKGEALIQKHLPTLQTMEIIDKEGNVDIDMLYQAAKQGMEVTGKVEYKGMVFNTKDVDSLYKFIKGGVKNEQQN